MKYWLLKSEPESFSIQDLQKAPKQTTCWDGVRNYQARNFLRDEIKSGDRVLFYHSNANPPAIVGTAKVVKEGYPDLTAQDKKHHHYDPASTKENPRWYMIDIQLDQIFDKPLGLDELKKVKALAKMELLRKGSRLSVQPVTEEEFEEVLELAGL
ncbi:EVE domain-containing protein [Anatilimnocola floriformis]|uniref:EVE domain-containing protein n=1 Tax=Anatilimnocola floriformis TaxID=2948575 RepID=UPI0020C210DE|nr:EVE domain-containing protein [Anatilimnocola floriformis]